MPNGFPNWLYHFVQLFVRFPIVPDLDQYGQTLVFFNLAILVDVKWYHILALIHLIIYVIENIFMCQLTVHIPLLTVFAHICCICWGRGILCLFYWWLVFLYVWVSPLLNMCISNILFHFMASLFNFLIMSFDE